MLFERVLPLSGVLGFWVSCYIVFLLLYSAVAVIQWGPLVVKDQLATVAAASGGLFALAVIAVQVIYVIFRGWSAVSHLNFWTQTMNSPARCSR